jgi:ferric-dicitrate binding protein FerR (iron transport regulator)
MTADPSDRAFADGWNELEPRERRHLRRLVRLGRPIEEPQMAELAGAYAKYQDSRPWARFFWLWFVPGVLLALSVAGTMHPVVVGVVIALAAQAVFAHYKIRKAARFGPATA